MWLWIKLIDSYEFDSDAKLWSEIDEKVWIRLNTWLCDEKYIVYYPFRMIDWDHEVDAYSCKIEMFKNVFNLNCTKLHYFSIKCIIFLILVMINKFHLMHK